MSCETLATSVWKVAVPVMSTWAPGDEGWGDEESVGGVAGGEGRKADSWVGWPFRLHAFGLSVAQRWEGSGGLRRWGDS